MLPNYVMLILTSTFQEYKIMQVRYFINVINRSFKIFFEMRETYQF